MPHSWNNNPDDRDLDVGTSLIENEEIEIQLLGALYASDHLLAAVEMVEVRVKCRPNDATWS
jgi:hypothetical protein